VVAFCVLWLGRSRSRCRGISSGGRHRRTTKISARVSSLVLGVPPFVGIDFPYDHVAVFAPGCDDRDSVGTVDPGRGGEVGTIDAERVVVGGVGITDGERLSPMRESGEAMILPGLWHSAPLDLLVNNVRRFE
jgi:hypothetical protein